MCETGFWRGKTPTTARFQRPGRKRCCRIGRGAFERVAAHRPMAANVMSAKSGGSPTISPFRLPPRWRRLSV
ncbi:MULTISPECIES: hypothetical protein [Geobacillus]|uniref:hypothetical protein n=1 Tax=Geobacillus TaxID=129337 RepID=UPI0012E7F4F4|nr:MULTISPECIES: hypothetical protein [Geobacillus]MDF9296975.1 hypothetical protein [Geobacillus stearothermophilus]QIZ68811.1 hypothetical protein HF500_17320 [Geobacillus subterraneus]